MLALQNKACKRTSLLAWRLNMQVEIAQLEALADKLFAEGKNYLGNKVLEIVYCLQAEEE